MDNKDRPQLPKRDWFTLEEVARRWGCTIEDLIDYGENEALRISVRPRERFALPGVKRAPPKTRQTNGLKPCCRWA